MVWRLERLSAAELSRLLTEGKPVLLPVAAVEHHGPLPVGSDILVADCICERLKGSYIIAPPVAYTVSLEHAAMGSTVSCEPSTFLLYLREILDSLACMARGVAVVCFHGGAVGLAYAAARWVRARKPKTRIVVVDFWRLVEDEAKRLGLGVYSEHAGYLEASLLAACGYYKCRTRSLEGMEAKPRPRWLLDPWTAADKAKLYDTLREIPCSSEDGAKLVEAVVARLGELCDMLEGRETRGHRAAESAV